MINTLVTALCEVYCTGPILKAVQRNELFSDCKYFVDMSLRKSPNETLEAFHALAKENLTEIKLYRFILSYFEPPGSELEACIPEDWTLDPDFLVENLPMNANNWLFDLHAMWLDLCRRIKADVRENQQKYSLLYVPNPFIVPGGRFREFYYWDSFWTIKGLLISSMYSTARGMIKNLGYMVDNYGFIPNGGRVYYLFRTQPPMFIPMVHDYVMATGDTDFIAELFPSMEKEFQFWIDSRSVSVVDVWYSFRYKSDMNVPRPESFREDEEMASHLTSQKTREWMWAQIASGAEAGWDFSSRWFSRHPPHAFRMKSIRTWTVIPVDLNSFICMNAGLLADMAKLIGVDEKYEKYKKMHLLSKKVMKYVHWNEKDGIWYDYDLDRKEHIKEYYISNITPLYAKCHHSANVTLRVYRYLKRVGALEYPRGIPTSFIKSGEQWDGDNTWAPLVHMFVEAFANTDDVEFHAVAERHAVNWLMLTYEAYKSTRAMFEKYNASFLVDMPYGGGGEYEVQTGFGWTNGVIMSFLLKYGFAFEKEVLKTSKTSRNVPVLP